VQAEGYRISGELARIEQQIAHQRELRQRLETARAEADAAFAQIGEHITGDERQLADLHNAIAEAEPKLEALNAEDAGRQEALRNAETALHEWQQRWDAYAVAQAESARWAEVERTKIEYLEKQGSEQARRREKLLEEKQTLDTGALEKSLADSQAEHDRNKAGLDTLAEALEAKKAALLAEQEKQRQLQAELAETRKQVQVARGRQASLEALQHAALGQEKNLALDWLRSQGLADNDRLGEALEVDAGWETAVETVLGSLLEAVLVDDPSAILGDLANFGQGRVALMSNEGERGDAPAGSLAAHVRGPAPLRALLARVHAVEDAEAARALLPRLADGESAITRGGEWVGNGWVRVLRSGEAQQGALAREAEIKQLRAQIEALGKTEAASNEALAGLKDRLLDAEQQREDAQRSMYLAHRGVSELAGTLQGMKGRLESVASRAQAVDAELAALGGAFEDGQAQARDSRARLSEAVGRMSGHEDERQQLDQLRRSLGEGREAARNAAREAREGAHKLALTLESQRASVLALSASLARMGSQRAQLEVRLNELKAQLAEGDAPVDKLQAERQTVLDQRVIVEKDPRGRALGARRRRERVAQVRADPPAARPAIAAAARGHRRTQARRAGAGPEVRAADRCHRRRRPGTGHRRGVAAGGSGLRRLVEGDRRHGREAAPTGAGEPGRDPGIRRAEGTQDLPRRAERRPGVRAGDPGIRHPQDRPRNPRPLQGNLRPRQRRRAGAVPAPVRRRPTLTWNSPARTCSIPACRSWRARRASACRTSRCCPVARRR
jgi:chromosome segregation protein